MCIFIKLVKYLFIPLNDKYAFKTVCLRSDQQINKRNTRHLVFRDFVAFLFAINFQTKHGICFELHDIISNARKLKVSLMEIAILISKKKLIKIRSCHLYDNQATDSFFFCFCVRNGA